MPGNDFVSVGVQYSDGRKFPYDEEFFEVAKIAESKNGKLERMISNAVRRVITQFREYPHIVPEKKITLYRGSWDVLEKFKSELVSELQEAGYEVSVEIGNRPEDYSIDVNAMLL